MNRIRLLPTKTARPARTNWSARLRLVMFEPFSTGLMILILFATFIDTSAVGIGMGIADVCDGRGHKLPRSIHCFPELPLCRFEIFSESSEKFRVRANCLILRRFYCL